MITTVAGAGVAGYSGDGGLATAAELYDPIGVAIGPSGNIFIADSLNNVIREVNIATGVITTVAGDGTPAYGGDGGPAIAAQLRNPTAVAVTRPGTFSSPTPTTRRFAR